MPNLDFEVKLHQSLSQLFFKYRLEHGKQSRKALKL